MKKPIRQLNNRLKGYRRIYKDRYLLIQAKILTDEQFILYWFCQDILADWDNTHGENYGTFPHSQAEIGRMLSWSDPKVSNVIRPLYEIGFLKKRLDGRTEVVDYSKESLSKMKPSLLKTKELISKMQELLPKEKSDSSAQTVAEMKDVRSKDPLVSYKDSLIEGDDNLLTEEDANLVNELLSGKEGYS